MQPLRRRQENFEDFGTVFPLEMMQMCVKNTIFFWPPKAAGAKKHPGVPLLAPCLGVPLLAPAFRKSQFLGVTLLRGVITKDMIGSIMVTTLLGHFRVITVPSYWTQREVQSARISIKNEI